MMLAWRNVWRNPRRTLVILTAVFIGVTGIIFLAALMKGMAYSMVENSINNLTGHVLIRKADFISDPSVDNRIKGINAIMNKVQADVPKGSQVVKRIVLEGIVNTARDTVGVTAVGTDMASEKGVSFIGSAKIDGKNIKSGDRDTVLIGHALSEKIGLGIGKRIVLNMQVAKGDIVSRAFRIKGIFHGEQKQQEDTFIFIPYKALAGMLGVKDAATEISVHIPGRKLMSGEYEAAAASLRSVLPGDMSVMTWAQVLPAINAYLQMFDGFMLIWYLVVFIAMSFGIVNTVLMAVYERMREFGILRAIGLKRSGVFIMVVAETSFIIITGLIAGNIASLLLIWLFSVTGIDLSSFASGVDMFAISRVIYPVFTAADVVKADVIILVLGMLVSVYPAAKACGFTPVKTMRNL